MSDSDLAGARQTAPDAPGMFPSMLHGEGSMPAVSRTIEHVGEWRIALWADTVEEIFAELARVVARALGTPGPAEGDWEPVAVMARDEGTLLVDWANDLLARSETRGCALEVRNIRLRPRSEGEIEIAAEIRRRGVASWTSPLKAATYHNLKLEVREGRWYAEVLFDV